MFRTLCTLLYSPFLILLPILPLQVQSSTTRQAYFPPNTSLCCFCASISVPILAYLWLTISTSLPHKSRIRKIKKPVSGEGMEAESIDYSFRSTLVKQRDREKE